MDATDADYVHAKRVCKDFEIREYHDMYVQSDTLLLANIFENFRNMCLKIYKLDPAEFLSAPGLAWQAALNKTKVKLSICKANKKYMKDYGKNKELSYIPCRDVNNLYGWAMSQKLPINNFEWIEDNEDFIKKLQ